MKNVLKPLAKSVLTPLGITAVASARYVAIQKKTLESCMATVIISNEKINDIMKIVNLEESGLLIQGVSETNKIIETIKNEVKKKKAKGSISWYVIEYINYYFIREYINR